MRNALRVLLILSFTVFGISCSSRERAPAGTQPAEKPQPQPAGESRGEPVIALWNDGAYMLDLKPFLLFAAWEDGTVVRRSDVAKTMGGTDSIHDWAARKLMIGSVKPSEVAALQEAIAEAGLFRPPLGRGLVFIDGPSQSLCVRYGKARRLLTHHGPSDKWLREYIGTLGPTGNPTRVESEAFAAMWDKIARLIDAIVPATTDGFHGEKKLKPPVPFDATDGNGNPSIAFLGLPEYQEHCEFRDTPQAVVTMTAVQTTTAEKYLQARQVGDVQNEERHGDWVYFCTAGEVQVPNDRGFIERISRYKVRMPEAPATEHAFEDPSPERE